MKRYKALSLVLALALMLSLIPAAVFAEDESAVSDKAAYEEITGETLLNAAATSLPAGSTVTATNINSSAPTAYLTPTVSGYSQTFTYKIKMPAAGSLRVNYLANGGSSYAKVNNKTCEYSETVNGVKVGYWYISSGCTVSLSFDTYDTGAAVGFSATYAPANVTLTPGAKEKVYILGRPSNSSVVSSFKVKVPRNGYLQLKMGDETAYSYSLYYKTSGFKDFELLSAKDARRRVGVKKGKYTIKVKSYSPMYGVHYKFVKVKQGKFGKKKSSAAKLKKKVLRKGLMITNAKKTHWYKIKNPKLQKVRIIVNGKLAGGDFASGGLKITIYDKRGALGSRTLYATDKSAMFNVFTYGKNGKLVKGTYWIKIQSYSGGNGYFSVKWK